MENFNGPLIEFIINLWIFVFCLLAAGIGVIAGIAIIWFSAVAILRMFEEMIYFVLGKSNLLKEEVKDEERIPETEEEKV